MAYARGAAIGVGGALTGLVAHATQRRVEGGLGFIGGAAAGAVALVAFSKLTGKAFGDDDAGMDGVLLPIAAAAGVGVSGVSMLAGNVFGGTGAAVAGAVTAIAAATSVVVQPVDDWVVVPVQQSATEVMSGRRERRRARRQRRQARKMSKLSTSGGVQTAVETWDSASNLVDERVASEARTKTLIGLAAAAALVVGLT